MDNLNNIDDSQELQNLKRFRVLRRIWRIEFFYLVGLIGFSLLTLFAYFNSYFGWDLRVARTLQSLPIPGLFEFMRIMSIFGDREKPYLITFFTIIILLLIKLRYEAAGLLLSTAGSAILDNLFKILINRPRPSTDLVNVFRTIKSKSFPSGHVTFYVCYFGFLFLIFYVLLPRGTWIRRFALTLTTIPIIFVGLSRIYLGEHWPSDTLGAYLMGGLWLAFSIDQYRRWKERG
jgi:membrane-associated phospholipid phosphatase